MEQAVEGVYLNKRVGQILPTVDIGQGSCRRAHVHHHAFVDAPADRSVVEEECLFLDFPFNTIFSLLVLALRSLGFGLDVDLGKAGD